jgi:nucleoside-diphosphate-sugar epimerase
LPQATILGGTGQIGRAIAQLLVAENWDVTLVSRQMPIRVGGFRHAVSDSRDSKRLSEIVGSSTDLLVSCVAFDADDADCLVAAGRAVGRVVVISSASVYCDAQGRTLDEAAQCGFPEFQNPLTEASLTVEPGVATYSTRKIAMERRLIETASCPVTVLRPCAIHGPWSKHAREWWFVKRLLDGRQTIPLAYRGRSQFQTTSVAAIGDAVLRSYSGELPTIANVSDSDCPNVMEIGRVIMQIMSTHSDLVGQPDVTHYPSQFGATPWSIPRPMIVSAAATGTQTYAQSVKPAIEWLVENVPRHNWQTHLPQLAAYPYDHFDYSVDEQALQ